MATFHRRALLLIFLAAPLAATAQVQPGAQPGAEERLEELANEVARLRTAIEAQGGAVAEPRAEEPRGLLETASELAGTDTVAVRNLTLRVVLALLVIALMILLIRAFSWLLEVLAERNASRRLLLKKLIPIARLLLWAITVYYIAAVIFQIDRTGILAASAALGIAIGFAAQDVLKNIFGGILIVLDQPFQVGDKIRVAGTYGEVVGIGIRSTRIVTPDDNLVSVPNSQVVENQVANANAGALDCQVVVDLFLPGWTDVLLAKEIAYEAAITSRYVFLDKPVVVHVSDDVKDLFLTRIRVKAYVIDTRHEFALASDITEAAKTEFLRRGLLQPMFARGPAMTSPAGAAGDGA